jgi:ferredoxin
MPKYRIEIDKEKCIGCGNCANVCPASFEMKEGKSNAKRKEIETINCEEEAANSCPVSAIEIKQIEG